MKGSALIGSTGFVGTNLNSQHHFAAKYHSKNIREMAGEEFDVVVCAAPNAEKWKANKEPDSDLANIHKLIEILRDIRTKEFILISTVDVYPKPIDVFEDTPIERGANSPYGEHRFYLEEFVRSAFNDHLIIRLPALFGKGLKKNFLFDMLHKPEALRLTHCESKFQFYSLDYLWKDIGLVKAKKPKTVNFATPPLMARELANTCFGVDFENRPRQGPIAYDMRSHYAAFFDNQGYYIWTRQREIEEIKRFVGFERAV
jgi:nucleoside-diphosphate-sugar epimerase